MDKVYVKMYNSNDAKDYTEKKGFGIGKYPMMSLTTIIWYSYVQSENRN